MKSQAEMATPATAAAALMPIPAPAPADSPGKGGGLENVCTGEVVAVDERNFELAVEQALGVGGDSAVVDVTAAEDQDEDEAEESDAVGLARATTE